MTDALMTEAKEEPTTDAFKQPNQLNNSYEQQEHPIKPEPTTTDEPVSTIPDLKPQRPPLPPKVRHHKPPAQQVIVLSFGSHAIRYGFASDSTPKRVLPVVAFPRRSDAKGDAMRVPVVKKRTDAEIERALDSFDQVCNRIIEEDLELMERRRGGGKPIPWKVELEPQIDVHWNDGTWLNAEIEESKKKEEEEKKEKEKKEEKEKVEEKKDEQKMSDEPQCKGEEKVKERKEEKENKTSNLNNKEKEQPIIGKDVLKLLHDPERAKQYDIIFPMWDGQLLFGAGAPVSLIRKAIDTLLSYIMQQLEQHQRERKPKTPKSNTQAAAFEKHEQWIKEYGTNGFATSFVTIVVPETSQRRDVSELVDAVFRSQSIRCAALFIHQSAVSCAMGAGLSTCAVVDIGHSATVVACIEDGMVCGESRIHLRYGFHHVKSAFDFFLHQKCPAFRKLLVDDYKHTNVHTKAAILDEKDWIVSKICEQASGFNVDENDSLTVTPITAPGSNRTLRVKLGVGLRAVPVYGLIFPELLKGAQDLKQEYQLIPPRGLFEKNSEDDNFGAELFNDLRRSGIATAALPIGLFANDTGQPAQSTVSADTASLVDAIVWSIVKAIEIKRPDQQARTPDHYRRYLNAILLAGGGGKIEAIGPALEGRIKKRFQDIGHHIAEVTVIDGGRGKGDEELQAAAAVLKDIDDGGLLDDTDTAGLPWKGGAVMVEAEAVNEYWLYRDDWEARNVRALRERVPFYW